MLMILFNIQNFNGLLNCKQQRCSCEHNDVGDWGSSILYLHSRWSQWSAACPNHIMPEKESLICIVQGAGWASQPVWTFWRMGNILPSPGNKPLFLSCPAGSPFTTPNELSCLMYNCVEQIALEQLLSKYSSRIILVSLNQWRWMGHTHGGGGVCNLQSLSTKYWNLKNTVFVDMMLSNVLHDLPFSQTQPLKMADD